MMKNLYSIRDRLNDFGPLFEAPNHDFAKRIFRQSLTPDSIPAEDLDLYFIGQFDSESGELLSGEHNPVFLVRGSSFTEVKFDV